MARQLLGNIKGDKGDPGTLANETIGVINKIDITRLLNYTGNAPITEFDIESGVVNYSDAVWYFSQINVSLNGVKHSFRVSDYLTFSGYNSGLLRLEIRDENNDTAFIENVRKNTVYTVDLTGKERQNYTIIFRVTNGTAFTGFIEKPMLVEGDIPVLWTPPSKTQYYLLANMSGGIQYSGNFSDKEKLTILGSPEGWNSNTKELLLSDPGIYQIHVSVSPNTLNAGIVEVDICNGDTVISSVRGTSPNTVIAFASVSTISALPRINVKVAQSIEDTTINVRGSNSTKIFIKKLPN